MLTFIEADHSYWVDGQQVPGVTMLLDQFSHWDRIPIEHGEAARLRGRRVHRATEYDDVGELDEATVLPADRPYLDAWRRFRDEMKPEWHGIEERVYHPRLRYAGTRDRRGLLAGEYVIADIKTGEWSPPYDLQLSAYLEADSDPPGDWPRRETKRYSILLREDGTYRLKEARNSHGSDFAVFQGLVLAWWWRKRNNI